MSLPSSLQGRQDIFQIRRSGGILEFRQASEDIRRRKMKPAWKTGTLECRRYLFHFTGKPPCLWPVVLIDVDADIFLRHAFRVRNQTAHHAPPAHKDVAEVLDGARFASPLPSSCRWPTTAGPSAGWE